MKLEYIGWVEEILELNYKVLKIVVLLCNWVKANYSGNFATMKGDKYDFTLINFTSLIPILNQFFTFPLHVKQVFFFIDPKEKVWKVVLWKEPYKRCVIKKVQVNLVELDMFKFEIVDEFLGLQALVSIDESIYSCGYLLLLLQL
jgi:hypothetical protein